MAFEDVVTVGLAMGSIGAAAGLCYPLFSGAGAQAMTKLQAYQHAKVSKAARELDAIFVEIKPKGLALAYGLGPLVVALLLFLLFDNIILAIAGAVVGIVLPDFWVRQTRAMRRQKFQNQLVDTLFVLSSSLRAGLSLTQAFEVLESEMPPPASQEFGLMIKEHRLGRTLEEALQSLNDRMPSEELHLITTAVMVARETGGDITNIITQLIGTIREKRKLDDKVKTLTIQGRLQAYIMSGLPVIFGLFVQTVSPDYFQPMLQDSTGRMLIVLAAVLWVVGMVILFRMCKVDI